VVVIGRNEGERLKRCLESLRGVADRIVYVDSGSSDGSIRLAQSLAGAVVELDQGVAFTAARARNAGFQRLVRLQPAIDYVFFVDGDCEVVDGWLNKAVQFLDCHPQVAVVCGFRREKHPEKSVYNMLCDFEWRDCPVGEMKACGGDALARVEAVRQMNGFRDDLICGEEPEMCVRLRQAGWQIWRLGEEMTLHDAAMDRFGQWWKRMVRSGYSFAQGAALHGAAPERHGVRESARIWIWGGLLPLTTALAVAAIGWWGLCLLALYPLQFARLGLRGRRSKRENWWQAAALVVSKFAEMRGQLQYLMDRVRGDQPQLIEYK
jgi:GT2 family glycosyltransferase